MSFSVLVMDKNRKIIINNNKDELKIVSNWGQVKRNVKLSDVVDPLIEKGLITPDQWMDIKNRPISEPEKMEEFMYILLKQKSGALGIFLKALRNSGFHHVADELEGIPHKDGCDHSRTHPRVPDVCTTETNKEGKSGGQGSASSSKSTDTVRQEDLHKMKEEIKDELRNIRENLASERKQDRDQLLLLQREHKHLQNDFERLRQQKSELSSRLDDLMSSVDSLKSKLEEKEREYQELKRINNGLREDLMRQNKSNSRSIQKKDKEKEEMEKRLEKKEDEYKLLQAMMETLKSDHEERLHRLKVVNKEKVRLDGEYKNVLLEKKELESKYQALNQQVKEVQVKHTKEVTQLQGDVKDRMLRIEELERDKNELSQQLSESEKENEELKKENKKLEQDLRRTEGDKEILQTRLRQSDLQKYTVPPFSSVARHPNYPPQTRAPPKPQWRLGARGKHH
ncbi:trichohyalin-like [Saccostrea echinata]|uniref:trichohyalin-like n=1 Tax=Saccostrea echinata TaxID=191078 RepID=UPI002A818F61|nr:trichohyalin-like [Saccostrea echinata]